MEIKKDVTVRLMECDKCLLLLPSFGLVSIHQNELLFLSFRDKNSFTPPRNPPLGSFILFLEMK